MSRLKELIAELCPNGVEYKELSECCNILDNRRKPVTRSTRVSGKYPYYGANGVQDYVSDYIFDGIFVLVGEDGSVLTNNGNPVVTWATGKIWVNNHAHIISEKYGVKIRYLYYYIQTVNIEHLVHGNIPKFTGSDFKKIKIAVPPLPIQEEIVRILDNFTELTAELTAELTKRKQQYQYYRDYLFANDYNGEYILLKDLAVNHDAKRRPITKGKREAGIYPYYGASGIVDYVKDYIFDGDYLLISEDGANLLARNTPIAFSITGKTWVNNHAHILKFTNIIIQKYVEYYINNIDLTKYIAAAAQPKLTQDSLNNIKIPKLSFEKISHIVAILDRFDALCNDLTSGLPAEIEARKKQYEYYRDKLLTFKEAL